LTLEHLPQRRQALAAKLLVLKPRLRQILFRGAPRLQTYPGQAPGLKGISHAFFAAVKLVISAVQVPVGAFNVEQQERHLPLKLGALLIETQTRDEYAFHGTARGERQ